MAIVPHALDDLFCELTSRAKEAAHNRPELMEIVSDSFACNPATAQNRVFIVHESLRAAFTPTTKIIAAN